MTSNDVLTMLALKSSESDLEKLFMGVWKVLGANVDQVLVHAVNFDRKSGFFLE